MMKCTTVLALLSCIIYVRGEICQCAAFFSSDIADDHKVYNIPDSNIADCSQASLCQENCAATFTSLTNDGDLSHITSKGITVAELSCRSYGQDIDNGQLAAYYRTCGSEWQYIKGAKGEVCCKKNEVVQC